MSHFKRLLSVFGMAEITSATMTSLCAISFPTHVAVAEEKAPGGIVATQVRKQGFTCKEPVRAKRDTEHSKPNATVWLLECKSASYRVRLVPKMAAKVERIEKQ